MATSRSVQLAESLREKQLVRFSRRFEDFRVRGYVLDIGPKFFLLALVSDRFWFDGFECFRIRDVSKLMPDPNAAFCEAALKKRGERIPKRPKVSVASIEELLLSANRAFPLLTIHRELKDPDICQIGRVERIDRGCLSLLEIDPNARWHQRPTEYRVNEITRVNFGGDYEDALHLVDGLPTVGDRL
jgi:hypothetical protein